MDLDKETDKVVLEIRAERMRRRVAYGIVHHDAYSRVARINRACDDAVEDVRNKEDPAHYRGHLVEIGALAIEALEDFDQERENERRSGAARTHP